MRGFIAAAVVAVLLLNGLVLWRIEVENQREVASIWAAEKADASEGLSLIFNWLKEAWTGDYWREQQMLLQLQRKMQLDEDARCGANLFSAVVNNAVGVFRQVNTVGEPIYKHVSGGAWGMRQINTVGQAIYKPSWFGSASQFVGKASSFFALAIDGFTVLDAVEEDLKRNSIHNTVCSVSKAAGGYYGAAYGAATGATALSFVPLVGPLVGGFIGGYIGTFSGSSIAGYVANVITATPGC